MRTLLALLSLSSLALLGGDCNGGEIHQIDKTVIETFAQEPAEQVDILMVVDNSWSMLAEQEKLAEEFEAFIEFFSIAQTDYHIGITTTDMTQQAGALVGVPNVITPTTPNPGDVFRNNVLVGADGSGFERGFDAAVAALRTNMRAGINAGFYRDEASLSIIFVSDEDDASTGPVHSYLNHFWDMKGQRTRDRFNASALSGFHPVTLEPADCGQVPDDIFSGAQEALRYREMAAASGGVVGSICAEDFDGVVGELGLAASGLASRFYLLEQPDPATFQLYMFIPGTPEFLRDGTLVPPEGIEGEYPWEYATDSDRYWIEFTDSESLPPLGSRMTLTYEYL